MTPPPISRMCGRAHCIVWNIAVTSTLKFFSKLSTDCCGRVDELVPGGVVHDDADRAELVTGPGEQRLDRRAVADVGTDADGLAAGLPHERDGLGGHRLVAVVDDDLVALGGEREADGPTDAVRGPGDEDGARGRWFGHGQPSFGLRVSSRVGTPVVIVSIWPVVRPRSASSGTTRRRMCA